MGNFVLKVEKIVSKKGLAATDLYRRKHVCGRYSSRPDDAPDVDLQRQRQLQLLLRHQPGVRGGSDTAGHRSSVRSDQAGVLPQTRVQGTAAGSGQGGITMH